ncbi:MAG: ABC transporter permease [Candidatus Obscuribacterales bacterium]|nr:ABC transporter permease [Candidatus Obscuribacterales bacterium]
MSGVLAIIRKDLLQWTRRPLYFVSSVLLAVLILVFVGNTMSGALQMPFGLHDPTNASELEKQLEASGKFTVFRYDDLDAAKQDLVKGKIVALASVDQDLLEDSVEIITEGYNPLVDDQISMGLLHSLSQQSGDLRLPLSTATLFPIDFSLRDYMTPGLVAYLCYVLAGMNLGFSWIYEWMEKTYRLIILSPNGLRSAIIAKTFAVTAEASLVLWLALVVTAPSVGFTLGHNFAGLVGVTLLSMLCFTCLGLGLACILRTIRIYTMTISIFGVALMFFSGIIVPTEGMPVWEQSLARAFPLYYAADAFKGVMLDIPANYTLDSIVLLTWASAGMLFATVLLKVRQAEL